MTNKKFNKIYNMTDRTEKMKALMALSEKDFQAYKARSIAQYNEHKAAKKPAAYLVIEKDVTPMYMMF